MTESLKQTIERVLPYWQDSVLPAVKAGKRCIIVGHGNSIRVGCNNQHAVLFMSPHKCNMLCFHMSELLVLIPDACHHAMYGMATASD